MKVSLSKQDKCAVGWYATSLFISVGESSMAPATLPVIKLPGFSQAQVQKAIVSLLKFVGQQQAASSALLDDEEELIYLQLALKKMPLQSRKDKPVPLPLPHPIVSPDGAEICLFVKDHQGEGHKEAKKRIAQFEGKAGVAKVVGLSKLRTKYESHEAKRELCKLYDLFLADQRVLPSLPKLIGKSFFRKKKQPIPVDLTAKDFPAQVRKACAATYLFKNSGTCVNLKVGRSSFSPEELIENIYAVLSQVVEHIPKKWTNIQAVFLKTADSVALPLFQTVPDAPARISAIPIPATEVVKASKAVASEQGEKQPAAGKQAAAIAGSKRPAAAQQKQRPVKRKS